MEQIFTLLSAVSATPVIDQRTLAGITGSSVGKVNALIRSAEQDGYLVTGREGKKSRLTLTDKGHRMLEQMLLSRSGAKLTFPPSARADTAVILAGGKRAGFDRPICLQPLGEDGQTQLDRMLNVLTVCGIQRTIIVTGWQDEMIRQHLGNRSDITILHNERYKWNGTMSGLALAEKALKDWNVRSFIVIKSDLVFEQRAIQSLIETRAPFAALLTAPGGGSDELLAELDENGCIFRFSKDIRQINRVQGEMTGIARISMEGFERMLEYFSHNMNPLISYEYVMESVGRLYRFTGVMVDDLCWGKIESPEDYRELLRLTYSRIERKERQMQEQYARDMMRKILPDDEVQEVQFAGGLTNTNYLIQADSGRYILRLPGRMTESMINRNNEKRNAQVASDYGFNCHLVYCNEKTGVKLSSYIENAETLTPRTVRLEENMALAADILGRLHRSDIVWQNEFNVFEEALRYEQLLDDPGRMYSGFPALKRKVFAMLRPRLEELGWEQRPCHNDLVAANLVKNSVTGRMYLIDWEYSGTNDPMFDIAALFLENDFSAEDEELFFHYYYGEHPQPAASREKILIFKILQDYLWSTWTVLKESRGDNFGTYGLDRFTRAQKNIDLWEKRF